MGMENRLDLASITRYFGDIFTIPININSTNTTVINAPMWILLSGEIV